VDKTIKKTKQKGFTMIEMIAAIFIISTGIMGVFSLVSQTISYISIASSRLTAIYLAQEGIEVVRNIRDSNFLKINKGEGGSWDDGLSAGQYYNFDYRSRGIPDGDNCSGKLFLKIDGNFYVCSSDSGGFERNIQIVKVGGDKIDIAVEVAWSERGRNHQVVARENLYQWYQSE